MYPKNYLTLAYEGNYVGRDGVYDVFTYAGETWKANPADDFIYPMLYFMY